MPLAQSKPLIPVKIGNPTAGVIRAIQREGEDTPPHLTNATNVLPYDLLGRKRIGQRPGITPLYNLNTFGGDGDPIQGMIQVGQIVPPGTYIINPPSVIFNSTNFVGYSTLASTAGLIVGDGPAVYNWGLAASTFSIGGTLTVNTYAWSTLCPSGIDNTYNPEVIFQFYCSLPTTTNIAGTSCQLHLVALGAGRSATFNGQTISTSSGQLGVGCWATCAQAVAFLGFSTFASQATSTSFAATFNSNFQFTNLQYTQGDTVAGVTDIPYNNLPAFGTVFNFPFGNLSTSAADLTSTVMNLYLT